MLAVFRREWKQLLFRWKGYVFLSLTVMMTGLFMLMYNFYYGYTGLEYPLNFLCVTVSFLLPILTVPMFFEERQTGIGRMLGTLPVSDRALVMGKYSALTVWLLTVSLCMGFFSLILSGYGTVSYATAWGGIFAFFCVIWTMMTIELFVSLTIRRKWLVWVVSYLIPVFLVGMGYVSSYLPDAVGDCLRYLSVFGAYTPFLYGLFDFRSVAVWLSVSLFFVFLLIFFADCARDRKEVSR